MVKVYQKGYHGIGAKDMARRGLSLGCNSLARMQVGASVRAPDTETAPKEPLCVAVSERTYSGFTQLPDSH